jgi:hypothetical protein
MKKVFLFLFILFAIKINAQIADYEKLNAFLPKKNFVQGKINAVIIDSAYTYTFNSDVDSTLYEIRISKTTPNYSVQKNYTPTRRLTYRDSIYTTSKIKAQYAYREIDSFSKDTLLLVNYTIQYTNIPNRVDSIKTASSFWGSSNGVISFYELTRNTTINTYNTKGQLIGNVTYSAIYPLPLVKSASGIFSYNPDGTLANAIRTGGSTTYTYPDAFTTEEEETNSSYKRKIRSVFYDVKKTQLKELFFFSPNVTGNFVLESSYLLTYDKKGNLIKVIGSIPKYDSYFIDDIAFNPCDEQQRVITRRGTSPATLKLAYKVFNFRSCNKIATNDIANVEQISVYPNPVNNEIFIQSDEIISNATIMDITGRIVSKATISDNKLDVSYLLSGFYLLKISINNQIKVAKFIKE